MGVLWRENMVDRGGHERVRSETLTFLPREMEDIACLALSICRVLEVEDDEEGQVAMACAILNHMRRFGREGGGNGGAQACEPLAVERLPWRAFAIACLVVSGDMEDPTAGATHFHRHTENPEWAQAATPKALIGSYVYYAIPV
jgi:hypothetical protein